ncbi:SDR family oxidoreductase [Aphanizomenon flos-aquae]|uniref:SDR family oxidoreductase n=1 Tax=Aphanizomenon flos-aquae TaxID=1176 RepID=UPI000484F6A5|nr:SDR family oxidoreductase [Aphanizomenon flos-aquae]
MKILVLGSTGMLGQALIKESLNRKFKVTGIAREKSDLCCDIANDKSLIEAITSISPDIIINTVAIVNLKICEEQPSLAYLINARPVAILSQMAHQKDIRLVQISTDHYYTGDQNYQHNENDPINLINEYARTKYIAEQFALVNPQSLVVRTNIVGFRHRINNPTFIEWVLDSLCKKSPMALFNDFFTSSIDVASFAKILFDVLEQKYSGVLNIANKEVFSKKIFIEAIANELGYSLENTKTSSMLDLGEIPRGESLGLNVSKVEQLLGYNLPTMDQVIRNLITTYREQSQ